MTETRACDSKPGPLQGIRVVEYGVFHAGPGATAILGDLGAEVIKIEANGGDPERFWTRVGDIDFSFPHGESMMFEFSNRNKKGIYLDIETERGRQIFHRLVKWADVFLTNLRKSTKAKLGLDYHTLVTVNPRIIHANVSGYGPEGPASDMGAFDPMGQGRSGMMFVTGTGSPALIHLGVLDQATAIAMSHAILAALVARERQGIGQEVHVSLYSTALWLLYANLMAQGTLGVDPGRPGDRSKQSPLRNSFRCKDEKWIIGVHHPDSKYWPRLCRAAGHENLMEDPRFADDLSRRAHCRELIEIFDEVFASRTRDEWMEILPSHGLMFGPVQQVAEVLSDPQALDNGYVVTYEHPIAGHVTAPGYPAHFSAGYAGVRRPSPALGAHTDEVLRAMGYVDEEIHTLREQGVVR